MTVRQMLTSEKAHFDVAPIVIDGVSYLRYDLWNPSTIIEDNKVVACGKRYHDTITLVAADDSEIIDVINKPEIDNEDYDPFVEDTKAWIEAVGVPELDVREFYGMEQSLFNQLINEFWNGKNKN